MNLQTIFTYVFFVIFISTEMWIKNKTKSKNLNKKIFSFIFFFLFLLPPNFLKKKKIRKKFNTTLQIKGAATSLSAVLSAAYF